MAKPTYSYDPCQVHAFHRPTPQVCFRYYVWPLDMGGPDTPENVVIVCPTGFTNISLLFDDIKHNGGVTAYAYRRKFAQTEVHVAELGWSRFTKGAV